MGKYKLPWNNFVPQTFGDAVAYEQQIKYLAQRLQKIEEEGMPTPDLTDLKRRVTELETEVLTIQNELQELDVEAVTARLDAVDEAITALETEQAAQSVEVTSHGNRLTTLESTVETQQGTIDNLSGSVATTDQAVNRLADDLTQVTQAVAGKQDKLTAGANITIENNVISSSGGGGSVVLDTEVTEDSQHAVTSEGIYNAIETAKSTLQTAHTADITRIDGELNTKATTASVTALRTDVAGDISRIETEYKAADGEIDTRLDSLETSQTATDASVATLNTNVSNLQQTQTTQGTTLTGLGNRMTTAEGNITQLQTDTSQLSGTVQGMQTTIQGKQDKLTAGTNITIENNIISSSGGGGGQVTLDDTVTETSSNGVKSSGIYTAIETAKSGLQESITDIDGRVDTLEADNTTNKSNISTLQSSVASAQDDIGTLQTGLTQEASDRDTADQALRVSINGNSSAINTLRTNTETSITQLQTDVAGKQDKLTAGSNITIENNVISSSGGGGSVIAGMTISELSQAISYSSKNSAIKAPDVVKQHGANGKQKVLLPSDAFTSTIGCPLITLPIKDTNGHSMFKAWPVDMYFEQPNVLTFKDYDNVVVEPTRAYNGATLYEDVDTFSSFAANPFFCPDVQTYIGTMDSTDLSGSDDLQLICQEVPISWRLASINTDNYPANYTYGCINMNKRIMKGYAVYTLGNSGSYPVHCVGVMLGEPLYDTLRIIDKHDLIVMNMKCTRWVNLWGGGTLQYKPVAIIPIY